MAQEIADNKIGFIKPIYRIANFFALVPPYGVYEGRKFKVYKFYAVLLLVILLGAYVASLHAKVVATYPKQHFTVAVIDAVECFVLTTAISVEIIRSVSNAKQFRDFTELFTEVDKCLEKNEMPSSTCNRFYVEIFLVHVYMLFLYAYDAYVWVNTIGVEVFEKYLLKDFPQYMNMITVLLIYNYSLSLKVRFRKLNGLLEKAYVKNKSAQSATSQIKVDNFIVAEKQEAWEHIKSIREVYSQLSALVGMYNGIFGWPILFLSAITFMGVLEGVNFALVVSVVEDGKFMGNKTLETDFISLVFLWCITLSVMGVVVAVTCDMTTKEAQRTATVCYNLLLDVPAVSNNVQDRILREELILLAQQATHQCPYFSAAGFFNVDYTMLFGLLGTVTSYIIVLIQINK